MASRFPGNFFSWPLPPLHLNGNLSCVNNTGQATTLKGGRMRHQRDRYFGLYTEASGHSHTDTWHGGKDDQACRYRERTKDGKDPIGEPNKVGPNGRRKLFRPGGSSRTFFFQRASSCPRGAPGDHMPGRRHVLRPSSDDHDFSHLIHISIGLLDRYWTHSFMLLTSRSSILLFSL